MLNREFGLISVIMAAYNAEGTIEMAIESVLNQTYSNWELIVVDDCSTDNTAEVVRKLAHNDKRIKFIESDRNYGVSYTRKYALDISTGEWIAILDSDDAWEIDKLAKQIALQNKTNAELLFTGSSFMDADGRLLDWTLHVPYEIGYRKLLKQNLISNSSVLVKRELYDTYYAMGDEMHEDFATWLRILKTGKVAYGIDEPLLVYRLSNNSKSSNKLKSVKMNWNTYRYIGLNIFQATYYMMWYMGKGLLKYKNLK